MAGGGAGQHSGQPKPLAHLRYLSHVLRSKVGLSRSQRLEVL